MKSEYDFSAGLRGRFFRPGAKLRSSDSDEKPYWAGPECALGQFTVRVGDDTLESYRAQPYRVTEDANAERFAVHGGYAHRQVYELVQNSADALLRSEHGRSILVRLSDRFLYCADNGAPIDEEGVVALMFSRMSSKRHTTAIGRFGMGFKSVLGVTDAPEFFSRAVSFRFDTIRASERIATVTGDAHFEGYPVLRLPEPIDPGREMDGDEELVELMSWATNVVRLPLMAGAHEDLSRQIREFPPEFLLFVDHVRYLTLEDGEHSREFMLRRRDGELILNNDDGIGRWRRYETTHRLSEAARGDWPLSGADDDVSIQWAAPVDRLDRPGQFWAFFPTETASLVAGILNAAWKTNEDRLNVLPGPYNEELIEAAAVMIADSLPKLATEDDPGRHLDALPRRHERGDSKQADLLRNCVFAKLRDRAVVPDQDCRLRTIGSISYPPRIVTEVSETEALDRWAEYAGRPRAWLHHGVFARNRVMRLAALNRLFPPRWDGDDPRAPQTSVARWLEALVAGKESSEAIAASKAAVRAAAALPTATSTWGAALGSIVLTADGDWRPPDGERLFLPGGAPDETAKSGTSNAFVHPALPADRSVLSALKALGIKSPSAESAFRLAAKRVLERTDGRESIGDVHRAFWVASRDLPSEGAKAVIQGATDWTGHAVWPARLRIHTRAGTWQPPHRVLLPGRIVSADGIDENVVVDAGFHGPDEKLLRTLGVVDAPEDGRDLSLEPLFRLFLRSCRGQYTRRAGLPRVPRPDYLEFTSSTGVGPLEVLDALSNEGKVRYTEALLDLEGGLKRWTMWHTGTNRQEYPKVPCVSFTTHMLRKHGRLRTPQGIVPLSSASGPHPDSADALRFLLGHSNASLLKDAFRLIEPTPEIHGADDPIPLTDVWRGLSQHLPPHQATYALVRCERIAVVGQPRDCIQHSSVVYLADTAADGESSKVRLVVDELGLGLSDVEIAAVLQQRTREEVEERRAAIRECPTDSLRLLAAAGEQTMRTALPASLLAVLESNGTTLSGLEVAEAAIATWHTDALKQLKWGLDDLDPPSQWAGSPQTVEFVTSLGFSPEWAGERESKRDPFVEVEGPRSLPKLHDFQRIIVNNIRYLLRGGSGNGDRRGIVSMPTGSGKTRVAVQAVVEAIRDDSLSSGVLWIADRDELCEQAVECWRHVWASVGSEAVQLRISRLWAGLEKPKPTSRNHVIVATIQTLNARLSNEPGEYAFLADFGLLVFDEAHRSIARTFTSVMEEIGLTRFRRKDEPFLLGLTATPYRGRDADETRRLVNRYGNRRLDAGAFESEEPEAVIRELQHTGVLAKADHETIEGGTFSLDSLVDAPLGNGGFERTLNELRTLPWLPQTVEDRIARSVVRTKRIVDAYTGHIGEEWPTLVFATSVEHTQTVAALLNREGVRSRAINGETDRSTRRRVVEEFRRGKVKALVNYGVFREGFDAPMTRAIVVARPVYSPNLYFQMVGRGLRGPLNGGGERCLILDVEDNIENFNRQLAFSELDGLWARSA